MKRLLALKQLQIDSLSEITQAINSNFPAPVLFRLYELTLMAQMGIRRLVVFHKNATWQRPCSYGIEEQRVMTIDVEKHLSQFKETTHLENNHPLAALNDFEILIPVYHKDEALAFLLVGQTKGQSIDFEEKIKFIRTYTNIIVVAIENKRLFKQQLEQESFKKELEVAGKVQNMLIPSELPDNGLLEMEAVYMPHHNIGGDYYDYVPINDNEFLVCMADISGKGIAAAILMANVQAVLRALARETNDLKELVIKLNARIMEITDGDKFVTLFIGKHNLETRTLSYINAGHNPPILVANEQVKLLETGCTILGAIEKLPSVKQGNVYLQPGTVIVTYTDGLTDLESETGEYFEQERLVEFVKTYAYLAMSDLNEFLLQEIKAFKGEQEYTDDISILSYRIH